MSEYQYYEFRAVDRPLSAADQRALRVISTRADITAHSFVNSYEWGDFKGDPAELMERWFDLHLYLANWGTRRLMIRLPRRGKGLGLDRFLHPGGPAELRAAGANLVLDIERDDVELDDVDDVDDGAGWLASLGQLRADILQGDLRVFHLIAAEVGVVGEEEREPMPGIAPSSGALAAFAAFFHRSGVDGGSRRAGGGATDAGCPADPCGGAARRAGACGGRGGRGRTPAAHRAAGGGAPGAPHGSGRARAGRLAAGRSGDRLAQ
jgi:hypothetical protein